MIYSFVGWVMEVCVAYYRNKRFVNRGFLMGPYCPIYGSSSVIMILYLSHYKDNPLTVFLLAVIICSFIEYIISYIMEKLFNARWWDYSYRKFNINGRVCLINAFFFGILGTLLVYFINPLFEGLIGKIPSHTLNIISACLMIIFMFDFCTSMGITFKLKNNIVKLSKDNTEEFNKKIKDLIENKLLNRRIIKAYPKYKINLLEKIEEYRKNRDK